MPDLYDGTVCDCEQNFNICSLVDVNCYYNVK